MYSVRLIFFDLCQETIIFDIKSFVRIKINVYLCKQKKIFFDLF